MTCLRRIGMAAVLALGVVPAGMALAATEIRIASHTADTGQPLAHAMLFRQAVEKRFPGQFEFKIYPSAQLGQEKALIGQIKTGALEIAALGSGPLALDKKLGVFDLPWLFKDWEHATRALKGELGKAVANLLETEQNMVVLGVYGYDFRHVINKVRPIVTPQDMDGLKIRVTGSKFRVDAFKRMGANPVPVPWSETFTALQTGAVDGAEATFSGFFEEKQYEVTEYLSLTNHTFGPTFLLASKAFMGRLTPEQQKAFREIGHAILDDAMAKSRAISDKYFDELKKVMKVNEADLEAFAKAAAPVYEDYTEAVGDDWIELVKAAREGS